MKDGKMFIAKLKKVRKVLADVKLVIFALKEVLQLIVRAWHSGHLKGILKVLRVFILGKVQELRAFVIENNEFGQLNAPSILALRQKTLGLHSLLPQNDQFRYSILIPVYRPRVDFFKKAVQSALMQSAPHCEVLIGLDGPQAPELMEAIDELSKWAEKDSKIVSSLRVFEFDRENGGGISHTTNSLARHATGNYLLLLDHDDWIAPDLLFRYEQCLRLLKEPENFVLFCDEYKINEKDEVILNSHTRKPEHPSFPYLFVNYICHCLLIPKTLWDRVGGLRSVCDGAQDYDLCLRLDLIGARFQNVPFYLYAWRAHTQSTAQSSQSKDYATPSGIRALTDYVKAKALNWEIQEGLLKTTYRAIPSLKQKYKTQVVIPYKDHKEVTLKAVRSVLSQKSVDLVITAVDNRSQDKTIAQELKSLGVEVLEVDEPFNYSRLNNFAVHHSNQAKHGGEVDCLLFLNNDVELESGAIEEMLRWIDQPLIGMVGARLHYPSRHLQHGGVFLNTDGPMKRMTWNHIDLHLPLHLLGYSKITSVCDAVTAACLLMKKDTFIQVGGFDEIWYPIAYSDTDLAVRVRRLGLYALYTPFAVGTHFESMTRGPGYHELPEGSFWMYQSTRNRSAPQVRLEHSIFSQ